MKRFVRLLSILLTVPLLLCACSTKRTFYAQEKIEAYVEDVFGSDWTLTETDLSGYDPEYRFSNEDGITFSVYSTNDQPISMDGYSSGLLYVRAVRDTYFEDVYAAHREELQAKAEEAGFGLGSLFESYHGEGNLDFYLDGEKFQQDSEYAEAAAEMIVVIDETLAYQCKYRKSHLHLSSNQEKKVTLTVQEPYEMGKKNVTYFSFQLSCSEKKRLEYKTVLKRLRTNVD